MFADRHLQQLPLRRRTNASPLSGGDLLANGTLHEASGEGEAAELAPAPPPGRLSTGSGRIHGWDDDDEGGHGGGGGGGGRGRGLAKAGPPAGAAAVFVR
jgi:hypothetical protein